MNVNDFLIKLFGSADSQKEFEFLDQWQKEGMENAKGLQEMLNINQQMDGLQTYKSFDVEDALAKNLDMIDESTPAQESTSSSYSNVWKLAALAAVFAALSYFFISKFNSKTEVLYANSFGTEMLENGAEVSLNEGSSYSFNAENNTLSLKGEAHFNVSPQKEAFKVQTQHGIVKVLGTSFNINTTEKATTIFMHHGVVEYSTPTETKKLIKGDFLQHDTEITMNQDRNPELVSYWLNQELNYKNVPLSNVLADLNRLYDKSFSAEVENADEILITSSFKGNSLEEIIEILEKISDVSIK